MLRKDFQGYLAYVVETGKEGTLADEISIVRENKMYSQMILRDYLQIEKWSSPLI